MSLYDQLLCSDCLTEKENWEVVCSPLHCSYYWSYSNGSKVAPYATRSSILCMDCTATIHVTVCQWTAIQNSFVFQSCDTDLCVFRFVLFCLFVYFYSSGLFPLLANAAMSVKPALLSLYEMYYLPLGKTLKPGLQGLLTGILPGLEEGSEYYER